MNYWVRELAGWALMLLGLGVLALVILQLSNGLVWQSTPMAVVGILIFRGGVHLLKVAVAARVCERAATALSDPPSSEALPARGLNRRRMP